VAAGTLVGGRRPSGCARNQVVPGFWGKWLHCFDKLWVEPSVGSDHWGAAVSAERQRIDKWLWHARVVRTREAAAALAAAGYVRINGARVEAAAAPVRCGDVVTVALDHGVRVLRVCGFAPRRGDAGEARRLFEDLA
jgi:ribosome-associated heat shock protein Hsp15